MPHGIFPLFNGLRVEYMEKPLHSVEVINGNETLNGDHSTEKPAANGAAAHSNGTVHAITNGVHGFELKN